MFLAILFSIDKVAKFVNRMGGLHRSIFAVWLVASNIFDVDVIVIF